ncbi:ubiquitin-protein ligase peroxin 12 [Tilletia horrida]|uniref:Peroxisome assembly protein 12 n=1 Tax=Tilletia horrida TaxID=155126 RepID=A0AAN6GQV1_9BASI|nr:ubiquitin-protein ligase peroxin 12 [Tilletia horrida]KAK0551688.1 ubiquitin-protein ligase peroxin 12 [Tilletia horrida]KAK0569699.1 ubiquitin-protein ligase peroxin 12 [Tilletia horrida]
MDALLSGVDSSADPYRPSFFELFAQDQLSTLLRPAIRYVLTVLAQRNPRYLLRLVNRFDEVYAVLLFAVERHYLTTWGSSFAENFYGLRRRRRPAITTDRAKAAGAARSGSSSRLDGSRQGVALQEKLGRREIYLSLLFLVGLPYLSGKATDYWERIGGGLDASGGDAALFGDEDGEAANTGSRLRFADDEDESAGSRRAKLVARAKQLATSTFRRGYPHVSALYQLWLLGYNVSYLFDKTPYWRPWFSLMRVDVRRMGAEDYPPTPPLIPPNLPMPFRHPVSFTLGMLRSAPFIFFESLKYALPASIFFFKFLEWWYSPDNPRRRRGGGGAAPGGEAGGFGQEDQEGGVGQADGDAPLFGPPRPLLPVQKGVVYQPDPSKFVHPLITVASSDPLDPSNRILTQSLLPSSIGKGKNAAVPGPKLMRAPLVHNACPICGTTPVNNPAMFPTGYVACFLCAQDYLESQSRCPVTRERVRGGVSALRKVLG